MKRATLVCRATVIGCMAVMALFVRKTTAENFNDDPNSVVVDVINRSNRLIDVDPGDQFWLSVPADSPVGAIKIEIDGQRSGPKWVNPGEFMPVQFSEPGTFKIRLKAARGAVLEPFTVTVFAPPADLNERSKEVQAPTFNLLESPTCTNVITRVSMGSVYAGQYMAGSTTVDRYPIRLVANGCGTATLTRYGGGWSQAYSFTNELSTAGKQEISSFIDVPVG